MTTKPGEIEKMFVINNHEKMSAAIQIKYTVIPGIKFPHMSDEVKAERIIEVVCDAYNTTLDLIKKKSRFRTVALPRMICMYLMNVHGHLRLVDIAKLFDRDHTTVIHSRETIRDLIDTEPALKEKINYLKNQTGL